MRRRGLIILALLILGGAAYLGVRLLHPPVSDSQQIVNQILLAAKAASTHQPRTLLSIIADDYNDGVYTKPDLVNLARGGLAPGGRDLRVVPYLKSLDLHGKTATTQLEAEITALPGSETGRYQITVEWRKGPKGWQVIRAHGWEGTQGLGS
jgi:hypothetical protein